MRSKDPEKRSTLSGCKPYISVVIVGRNDGYGANFLDRLRMFMRSLDHQVARHPDLIELIIVEWNPLAGRESMKDVIDMPKNYPVRIITVPADVHDSIDAEYPVLEFYAKNVGARRAHGAFVLLTNPDIIFSQEMINVFAVRGLDPDCFYRTDRFDFDGTGIESVPMESLVNWIIPKIYIGHMTQENISTDIAFRTRAESIDQLPRSRWGFETVHSNGAGDFVLASREAFDEIGGMIETTEQRWHIDAYSCVRFYRFGFDSHIFTAPWCIFHTDHPRGGMDRDVEQKNMEDFVLADKNKDWGMPGREFPEWRSRP